MSIPRQFSDENARYQIQNGSAEDISAAAALADPTLVVGRGIYVPQWRDFTWKHIARVERQDDKIAFIYLDTEENPDPSNGREGNVTTEITITKVVERTSLFADDEEVLVCKDQSPRPKGRRHGKVTSWVNEEFES